VRKFLFLPHCLRNTQECQARITGTGYQCLLCGKCKIKDIIDIAINNKYIVFIVPGASMVKSIFTREKIAEEDVVVGVACQLELKDFRNNFLQKKNKSQNRIAVPLKKDGCINTEADMEMLSSILGSDREGNHSAGMKKKID
jgi:uncharacterized protein